MHIKTFVSIVASWDLVKKMKIKLATHEHIKSARLRMAINKLRAYFGFRGVVKSLNEQEEKVLEFLLRLDKENPSAYIELYTIHGITSDQIDVIRDQALAKVGIKLRSILISSLKTIEAANSPEVLEENRTISAELAVVSGAKSRILTQYDSIKKDLADCIVLFQVGCFYQMYYDDAKKSAPILDLKIYMSKGMSEVPICGIPVQCEDLCLDSLTSSGFSVAVCRELDGESDFAGIKKRGVTDIYKAKHPNTEYRADLPPKVGQILR